MTCAKILMRELSRQLIENQIGPGTGSEGGALGAFEACERLRPYLTSLMGKDGFHALLSRAVSVAQSEVAALSSVTVSPDGSLSTTLHGAEVSEDSHEAAEGGVVILAQLLGLLVAFIGENLTLRIVRDLWPSLSPEGVIFTKEI